MSEQETGPGEGGEGEVSAIRHDSCPACGAKAQWHPGRQALICPYCATVAPTEEDHETGVVREIDLVTALRDLPDEMRGWKAAKRSVRCRSCRAISVFDPERVGQNCEFCGSPELVDYDEIKSPLSPRGVLPFRVDETKVRESIHRWYAKKWLAPGALKRRAAVDTVRGIYLPYWTFDAQTVCPWSADAGTYYTVQERVRGADGKVVVRPVQKVRWRPASGTVRHAFDDTPIPGTRGVRPDLLRRIEPFPTGDSLPYDTAYLAGFVVEHYQVVLIEAAQKARDAMVQQLEQMCAGQVPGDTYRNLRIDPRFSDETFKHILVPVWLLSYQFGRKNYQMVVNGVTGEMAGDYPKSAWKVFFLVVGALLVVLILALLAQ